jgi:glycosyltransferase involved in cell wall biosynthesis
VITVSESTKRELVSFGFSDKKIYIISEGIEMSKLENLESVKKFELPTMLAFGSIRPMKRTLDIVKAFELVKKELPMVQLILAGDASGKYGEKVLQYICESEYRSSVIIFGKVLQEKKIELMSRAHVLCVSSVKEGWGLVVSESNSQGTPAVVYDVDGLRDSVRHGETGTVCPESPKFLANAVLELLKERGKYEKIRKNAYEWSKMITFEQSFKDFLKVITKL